MSPSFTKGGGFCGEERLEFFQVLLKSDKSVARKLTKDYAVERLNEIKKEGNYSNDANLIKILERFNLDLFSEQNV